MGFYLIIFVFILNFSNKMKKISTDKNQIQYREKKKNIIETKIQKTVQS